MMLLDDVGASPSSDGDDLATEAEGAAGEASGLGDEAAVLAIRRR